MANTSKARDQLDNVSIVQQQMQYPKVGQQQFQDSDEETFQQDYQSAQPQLQRQRDNDLNDKPHPEQYQKEQQESYGQRSQEHYPEHYQMAYQIDSRCVGERRENGGVGKGEFPAGREIPTKASGRATTSGRCQLSCQSCIESILQRRSPPRAKPRNVGYDQSQSPRPSKSPDPRNAQQQRSNNTCRPRAIASTEASVRSCCNPCYDTAASLASTQPSYVQGPPSSCCAPCNTKSEKKVHTKPPPEPFCGCSAQPQQRSRSENVPEQPTEKAVTPKADTPTAVVSTQPAYAQGAPPSCCAPCYTKSEKKVRKKPPPPSFCGCTSNPTQKARPENVPEQPAEKGLPPKDDITLVSTQPSYAQGPPSSSCCTPCCTKPGKKVRNKTLPTPPAPFCGPSSQPQKGPRSERVIDEPSEPSLDTRIENQSEKDSRPIDNSYKKKTKKATERCAGCYEPRPEPEPIPPAPEPRVRRMKSEDSCECECEQNVQPNVSKPTDYAEFRRFGAMVQRNPLVVRSYGCLSQCPTQGGSMKSTGKKKKAKTKFAQSYDQHGFQPCQAEHPARPVASCASSQTDVRQAVSADYTELQNRSGRFIRNPITVSNCTCNMQPRNMPQQCKQLKTHKQAPQSANNTQYAQYCSNETMQTQYCSNETIQIANPKSNEPIVQCTSNEQAAASKCTPCNKRKINTVPCASHALPPLVNNNRFTNFVPCSWFSRPKLSATSPTEASLKSSCSALPAHESCLPSCNENDETLDECSQPKTNSESRKRRCSKNNRHLSGCSGETNSERGMHINLKTRRICPSKMSPFASAIGSSRRALSVAHSICPLRMPQIVLTSSLKRRRPTKCSRLTLKSSRLSACPGTRIRKREMRCRGGKLTVPSNNSQGARPKPQAYNRSSSSPANNRLQTAVRRDRANNSHVAAQRSQNTPGQPRPKPQPPSRREQPQRTTSQSQGPNQMSNRPSVQPTEHKALADDRRSVNQPARGGSAPESSRPSAERCDRSATFSAAQSYATAQAQERTQERAWDCAHAWPEEWPGNRPPNWATAQDAFRPPQRHHKKSSEKHITTQRPQFLRDGQVQPLPEPARRSDSHVGSMGTNMQRLSPGSFVTMRSNLNADGLNGNQVSSRRRGSLIQIAQQLLMPKVMKNSMPTCANFVVPNKWSSVSARVSDFSRSTAMVELQTANVSETSTKTNWTWRKLVPSWLLSSKTKTSSA